MLQEVAGLLHHAYPSQADDSNPAGTNIRAIEPEYRQVITIEPLTERELGVATTVDGHSNDAIARKLYLSVG